jgi:ATP-dependent Lon protease
MLVSVDTKQSILRIPAPIKQLYAVVEILTNEINILKIEQEIDNKVQENIHHSQRSFFIQEQIRILQRELGQEEEDLPSEYHDLHGKILQAKMPEPVLDKALEEFDKLKKMSMMSPEATVSRNYLDWLIAMPWATYSDDNLDINNARDVLDEDHYGLDKPKDRILEHIAVLNLVHEMKGQILCFVGPPGVGKTSLGKSIARALGRKFVRISLGGVHDEAEIRGHRRTYIGSMPGKIIQAIKKAGTSNPVILLDEIDKMSMDFQGDPASAMLEVLDPEQNHTFNDHYLDVDFDLSRVMFITTANVRYDIPLPLQDRMEIIELPGYLEHEKYEIAKRHLVKKQVELHGLTNEGVRFLREAILRIIREYTMEAGVRNLERELANVCRKIAKQIVTDRIAQRRKKGKKGVSVTGAIIENYLGVPKLRQKALPKKGRIGSVNGLAWTSFGGDTLRVDVTIMKGADKFTLTGSLGDVMKESAHAALSYLRSHAKALGIAEDFSEKKEIHIHIPEGAIPKDGPSAGITLMMAMLSAVSGKPTRHNVAMTGEITLHGEVLPIGGLNEKLLAARRHGIKTVIIPMENEKDLKEISEKITKGLTIVPVAQIEDAIPYVFGK